MFSLLDFVKLVLLNQAPTTSCTALQPIPFAHCGAKPITSAIVTQAIALGKTGQVKCQGSWWRAQCNSGTVLAVGDVVQVIYRQDLTLYVEPSCLTMSLQTALSS